MKGCKSDQNTPPRIVSAKVKALYFYSSPPKPGIKLEGCKTGKFPECLQDNSPSAIPVLWHCVLPTLLMLIKLSSSRMVNGREVFLEKGIFEFCHIERFSPYPRTRQWEVLVKSGIVCSCVGMYHKEMWPSLTQWD